MPDWELGTPSNTLYRIGRRTSFAWPPWDKVGNGRFDDPEGLRYRVLYAGERRACFAESLARFRPPPVHLLDPSLLPAEVTATIGRLPAGWLTDRRIMRFVLRDADPPARWLDLREPAAHQLLRRELAGLLVSLAFTDFDLSAATSSQRALTQPIGGWAHDRGYQGIVYGSRIDLRLACYAIFERDRGVRFAEIDHLPLSTTDRDLRVIADLFNLSLPAIPEPGTGA